MYFCPTVWRHCLLRKACYQREKEKKDFFDSIYSFSSICKTDKFKVLRDDQACGKLESRKTKEMLIFRGVTMPFFSSLYRSCYPVYTITMKLKNITKFENYSQAKKLNCCLQLRDDLDVGCRRALPIL